MSRAVQENNYLLFITFRDKVNSKYGNFLEAIMLVLRCTMPSNIEFYREFGRRIAIIRKSQVMTQEKFAQKLGIKQPILAMYEKGQRKIPVALLLQTSCNCKFS
jgi:predicted transcriptional regulator